MIPPPPTPKQSLLLATHNSFDPASYAIVGVTSLIKKGLDTHPEFGKGPSGYGEYYWRGFTDRTIGSYLVMFAYPTVLRQDTRYVARCKGPVFKRGLYAATRIFVARSFSGESTFNSSEILGRATAQTISLTYYPNSERTPGRQVESFAYTLGIDAATNVFFEFWPDIASHVLHRHP